MTKMAIERNILSVREHPDAYAPSNAGRRGMSREAYAPLVLYYVLPIFSYI